MAFYLPLFVISILSIENNHKSSNMVQKPCSWTMDNIYKLFIIFALDRTFNTTNIELLFWIYKFYRLNIKGNGSSTVWYRLHRILFLLDILQVYWLSFNHKNMLNCGNVLYYCVLVSPIPYYIWYIQKAEREAKIQQSFRQILRGNEIYLARF